MGWETAKEAVGAKVELVAPATLDAVGLNPLLGSLCGVIDASMQVRFDAALLAAAKRLKVISCATTGSDHIDREGATRRGIAVFTLRDAPELLEQLTPAAELTWALVLACARRLPAAARHVSDGGWNRELFPGMMLRGRRLGIVGCGRIGSWVGRYGAAFGMDVVGFDPLLDRFPAHIQRATKEELLRTADVVTVHVHLSEATRGLLGPAELRLMKPGSILVNTSRGGIVDEAALLSALEDGRLAGVGLDVLEGEPNTSDHPLVTAARTRENLLITPHCGGNSPDAVEVVVRHAALRVLDALRLAGAG